MFSRTEKENLLILKLIKREVSIITLIIIFITLLGLVIGSFLNVVIYRLPIMIHASENKFESSVNLLFPGSFCPRCQHRLRWWHNIPLVSFILLRGNCFFCHVPISRQYPFIEFITASSSAFLAWRFFGDWVHLVPILIFTWWLIALMMIDIKTMLLPDNLTLSLLWLGLFVNSFHLFTDLKSAVWGAAAAYIFLYSLNKAYEITRKKTGMGGGDFKLLAALGAWIGWTYLPFLLFIASLLALLMILLRRIIKKIDFHDPIPFGPFLALAGWVLLLS